MKLSRQEETTTRNIDNDNTKRVILECIYNAPGIRYKELLRLTQLKNGLAKFSSSEI